MTDLYSCALTLSKCANNCMHMEDTHIIVYMPHRSMVNDLYNYIILCLSAQIFLVAAFFLLTFPPTPPQYGYYPDNTRGLIAQVSLSTAGVLTEQVLITSGLGRVQGLAVDLVSGNALFSNFMQGTICSTTLFKHHHSGPDRPTQTKKP